MNANLKLKILSPQAVIDSLSVLRNKHTEIKEFQFHADRIFQIIGNHIVENLPKKIIKISTPVDGAIKIEKISDSSKVLIIAILRSGLPAANGIKTSLPDATLGLIDIKRNHKTSLPELNYNGIKEIDLKNFEQIIIPDPMLATAGSAIMALQILIKLGAKISQMHLISLVASPEGVKKINGLFPELQITCVAIDEKLNHKNYIYPGLGDFGDRYYGSSPMIINDELNNSELAYQDGILIPGQKKRKVYFLILDIDLNQQIIYFRFMAHDEHHEHLIKEVSEIFEPILSSSPQSIYIYLDDTHKICNQRFADILEYESIEAWVKNESTIEDIIETDQNTVIESYQNASENLEASFISISAKTKSGTEIDLDVIMVPFTYKNEVFVIHYISADE